MNKITAIIDDVKPAESIPYGEGKTFDKQVFKASIEGTKSTNYLEFELVGDDIGKLSASDVGRKAELSFFINGRKGKADGKYADRIFMSLKYAGHEFVEGDEPVVEPEALEPVDDELGW